MFWMVWCEGRGAPQKKHTSLETAKMEAARLATNQPNFTFYVLQTVGEVKTKTTPAEFEFHLPPMEEQPNKPVAIFDGVRGIPDDGCDGSSQGLPRRRISAFDEF